MESFDLTRSDTLNSHGQPGPLDPPFQTLDCETWVTFYDGGSSDCNEKPELDQAPVMARFLILHRIVGSIGHCAMILQLAEKPLLLEEPSPQMMDVLLKTADSVLARAKSRTLRPFSDGMEPRYEPAVDPVDMRLCA